MVTHMEDLDAMTDDALVDRLLGLRADKLTEWELDYRDALDELTSGGGYELSDMQRSKAIKVIEERS